MDRSRSRTASRFTARALEKEGFLLVCDAAREILRYWEREGSGHRAELLRVRMHYAAALTRLGFVADASRQLEPCVIPAFRPAPGRRLKAEILRQLGDIQREAAHLAPDRATSTQAIEAALRFYRHALELEPDSLDALLWVSMTTLYLSGAHGARRIDALAGARQLLKLVAAREDVEGGRFATTRARAEAYALLGKNDEAIAAYSELQNAEDTTISALAEARYRTGFLADAVDQPRDFLKHAFPPLQLIVFAGHLPDRPGELPRFPAARIDEVRAALRAKLAEMRAHIGIACAAAGADLLFLDELQARPGGLFHVVLPWSENEFRHTSVRPYEPGETGSFWEPLFDKAVAAAASVRELGQLYPPRGTLGWQYMAEVTAGLALHTARVLRLDVQPLALWDGQPGRGPVGTEAFVQFWREQLGEGPAIVEMPPLAKAALQRGGQGSVQRAEKSMLHQEVKTLLFADIVGYSKLREQVIPEYIAGFFERVSQLAATSRHAPQSLDTWGDAIYAVFDFAVDAGNFALELTAMIHSNREEWLQKGLYWEEPAAENELAAVKHPMNIRIGLHTGPVFLHYNPVVRRLGFTGAHVSRAARIEPVTQPGEVFASEEFAALVELDAAIRRHSGEPATAEPAGFVCEYAGSIALAKDYPGRYRIYRLAPARRLDIEELARAIHDLYCEEEQSRGQTLETNSMLRSWDKLPEDIRDANRAQAADIPNKLHMLGYELAHRHGVKAAEMHLDPERAEAVARA
jgi:class 3 adenylate cyclase/tetratricopeptide (TPR) repeat protein